MSVLDGLTPEQRAWLIADERRWSRAHDVASRHPGVDVGGVYRVLRNLEKTPTERLRAAAERALLEALAAASEVE